MSQKMTSEAVTFHGESAASNTCTPDAKSSRRARNNDRWDSLKEEIFDVYMKKDGTLQNTKQIIETRHGYVASVRKWKEKLKEWKFEKNISASDMAIVLSKAEKRSREESKETAIFHGGTQVSKERIEQFKRRKTFREEVMMSPSADTPQNITYNTPPPEPPEPLSLQITQNFSPISESNKLCLGDASSPLNLAVSEPYQKSGLSILFERVEGETSEETSEDTDIFYLEPFSDAAEVIMLSDDLPWKQDSSASPVRCVVTDSSARPEPHNSPGIHSEVSFSDTEHIDQQLDQLSLGFGGNNELDSPIRPMAQISENTSSNDKLDTSVQPRFLEPEIAGLTSDSVINANKRGCSFEPKQSDLSESSTDLDSGSNFLMTVTTTPVVPEATIKSALELDSQGWLTTAIFKLLAGTAASAQLKFCEDLWRLGLWLEANLKMNEALMTYNLIRAGHQVAGRLWTERGSIKCLGHRARLLRKMARFEMCTMICREAIKAFRDSRDMGKWEGGLDCLLDFADLLSTLDMDSEALHLLLEVFARNSLRTGTSDESQMLSKLLFCVQRIHTKIETGESLANVTTIISRMRSMQLGWIVQLHSQNLRLEIIQLGSHYSKIHKFDLADLCFGYSPLPDIWGERSPITRFRRAQLCKELGLHYNRQGKRPEAIQQLGDAFQHLLSLELEDLSKIDERDEEDLAAALEQVLNETCPKNPTTNSEGIELLGLTDYAWDTAQAAFVKFSRYRNQLWSWRAARKDLVSINQRHYVLVAPQEAKSNSSSMLSKGSINSTFGVTYSVGSAASIVSNSIYMVP